MTLLALDIGGANLKAADGHGFAVSQPFPLWQQPNELPAAIDALLSVSPPARRIVATMTGELADCYRTKSEGVAAIVAALTSACAGRELQIYLTDGSLVDPNRANEQYLAAAASNWHALARFAARYVTTEAGLLFDLGSTTCDLIPVRDGHPATRGFTDPARLAAGELVYTGVARSPVCAVVSQLPWRGQLCPTAHEVFATTRDAYLLLGDIREAPHCTATADGRPATRAAAHDRLARSICADRELFDEADARQAATAIREAQVAQISQAIRGLRARSDGLLGTVVISGEGEFLARRVITDIDPQAKIISLAEQLGPVVSRCAPAHALAVLAREG